jgi:hypothetical protein
LPRSTKNAGAAGISNSAPAIALSLTGDKLGVDPAKCLFFENGYYDKLCRAMGSFTNLTPMEKC